MEEVRSVAEYIECLKGYQRSGLCGYRPEVRYYYRGESRDYGATSGQAMIGREHEKCYAVFDSTRIIPQAVPVTVPSPTWCVTASGRNFQVHAAPVGKSYALFDLQGKVLAKGRVESSEMIIFAPRAGSYIVRVGERSVRVNAR